MEFQEIIDLDIDDDIFTIVQIYSDDEDHEPADMEVSSGDIENQKNLSLTELESAVAVEKINEVSRTTNNNIIVTEQSTSLENTVKESAGIRIRHDSLTLENETYLNTVMNSLPSDFNVTKPPVDCTLGPTIKVEKEHGTTTTLKQDTKTYNHVARGFIEQNHLPTLDHRNTHDTKYVAKPFCIYDSPLKNTIKLEAKTVVSGIDEQVNSRTLKNNCPYLASSHSRNECEDTLDNDVTLPYTTIKVEKEPILPYIKSNSNIFGKRCSDDFNFETNVKVEARGLPEQNTPKTFKHSFLNIGDTYNPYKAPKRSTDLCTLDTIGRMFGDQDRVKTQINTKLIGIKRSLDNSTLDYDYTIKRRFDDKDRLKTQINDDCTLETTIKVEKDHVARGFFEPNCFLKSFDPRNTYSPNDVASRCFPSDSTLIKLEDRIVSGIDEQLNLRTWNNNSPDFCSFYNRGFEDTLDNENTIKLEERTVVGGFGGVNGRTLNNNYSDFESSNPGVCEVTLENEETLPIFNYRNTNISNPRITDKIHDVNCLIVTEEESIEIDSKLAKDSHILKNVPETSNITDDRKIDMQNSKTELESPNVCDEIKMFDLENSKNSGKYKFSTSHLFGNNAFRYLAPTTKKHNLLYVTSHEKQQKYYDTNKP